MQIPSPEPRDAQPHTTDLHPAPGSTAGAEGWWSQCHGFTPKSASTAVCLVALLFSSATITFENHELAVLLAFDLFISSRPLSASTLQMVCIHPPLKKTDTTPPQAKGGIPIPFYIHCPLFFSGSPNTLVCPKPRPEIAPPKDAHVNAAKSKPPSPTGCLFVPGSPDLAVPAPRLYAVRPKNQC
jgi:hypothetical protein